MTATIISLRVHRARKYARPLVGSELATDLLVSLLESTTASQLVRWTALRERCGLSGGEATRVLGVLGYGPSGDRTEPCARPSCERRVGPRRFAVRVNERIYCSTGCAYVHADERAATRS